MGGAAEPSLGTFGEQVLAVVRRALAGYGPDAADVEVHWVDRAEMHFIEVRPQRPDAAQVSIGLMAADRELSVNAGRTRFEIWRSKRRPDPCAVLEEFLEAVFAGRMEEAGGRDGFARIPLRDGRFIRVGSAHLPLPWSWRRPTRYVPYRDL